MLRQSYSVALRACRKRLCSPCAPACSCSSPMRLLSSLPPFSLCQPTKQNHFPLPRHTLSLLTHQLPPPSSHAALRLPRCPFDYSFAYFARYPSFSTHCNRTCVSRAAAGHVQKRTKRTKGAEKRNARHALGEAHTLIRLLIRIRMGKKMKGRHFGSNLKFVVVSYKFCPIRWFCRIYIFQNMEN